MIKTFALILYVLNPQGESSFAIDYNLTLEDCINLRYDWESSLDEFSSVVCHPEDSSSVFTD
jgi:hypothetical protein